MTAALSPGEFLVGCALLAVTLGCCAAAALMVEQRALPYLGGVVRLVALTTLTLIAALVVHIVPLAVGILARGSVAATSVLLLATVRLSTGPRARREHGGTAPSGYPPRVRSGAISFVLAAVAVVVLVGWALAYLQSHVVIPVTSSDMLGFHLPGVIGFLQTGSLWHVTQFIPGQAQGNYPQYGDTLLLLIVLPWHSLAFIRYVDPVLLAVAGASIYATARELRAPAPTAALAACAFVTIKPVLGTGLVDVLVDPAFLAGFGAGLLFLVRYWRTRERAELVLAGLGFGIAIGTKWYGVSDVPLVVVIWALAALLTGRGARRVLTDAAILAAVVLVAGGVWLLRNVILTGNPVFDYKVSLFGGTIFPAPPSPVRTQIGWSIAHYFGDAGVLRRYVWPVLRADFGLIGGLAAASVPIASVTSWWQARRGPGQRGDARVIILAVASVALALAYAITPYSALGFQGMPVLVAANTRYGVPALMTAIPLLAWLGGRLGRFVVGLDVVLLGALVLNLDRYLPLSWGRVAIAVVVIAIVAGAWEFAPRLRDRAFAHARPLLLAGLSCLGLGLAYHWQRLLSTAAYSPREPTIAYLAVRDTARTRIGITGSWTVQGLVPVAPLFGRGLEHRVSYVGPVVAHRTEQYLTASAFESALRRGRFPWLEVGTGFPPSPDPTQERWAERVGYVPVARSARLVLLRARQGLWGP